MKISKKQLTTIAIHLIIWVAIGLLPLLFKPSEVTFSVFQLQGIYLNVAITILVFYLGYSLIIPLFFYKKKIVVTVLLLALTSGLGSLTLGYTRSSLAEQRMERRAIEFRKDSDMQKRKQMKQRGRRPWFDNFFFLMLISGAALSLRATQKWMQEEHDRKSLEAEKALIELAWLKNQVSPHFFFNTLNNIHSLIESKPEYAQKSVHMLSKLMRYLLYESNATLILLSKEISFIENYIGLMKLKLTDNVKVSFDSGTIPGQVLLPPLLFNPLIENAFKFGVSYQKDSFIKIKVAVEEQQISLVVENSISKTEAQQEHAGIGITNLKQRLDLLYKKNYSLNVEENPDTYRVGLTIPVEVKNDV